MAWHILHTLLEQVRIHSTFPGKLWIVMMFVFRMVVVARIGDNVYEDEQASFVCNTLTPGCENVCFNHFSPISQLRFWSLMVLIVSVPGILFLLYATHIIYHADIKFPVDDDSDKSSESNDMVPPTYESVASAQKRRLRSNSPGNLANGHGAIPLFEVKKISNFDRKPPRHSTYKPPSSRYGDGRKLKRRSSAMNSRSDIDEDKDLIERKRGSITDNNYDPMDAGRWEYRTNSHPVYVDAKGRRVEFIKTEPVRTPRERMEQRQLNERMLMHPEIFRAYWWHVFFRLAIEVAFLVGQYYLYGWSVPELYECRRWPCPKTVDCFVSRPQEKTCLLWLMYAMGFSACLISLFEFYFLGMKRLKYAFMCNTGETYEEKRRRLARLNTRKPEEPVSKHSKLTGALSLDSLSSSTTVESV